MAFKKIVLIFSLILLFAMSVQAYSTIANGSFEDTCSVTGNSACGGLIPASTYCDVANSWNESSGDIGASGFIYYMQNDIYATDGEWLMCAKTTSTPAPKYPITHVEYLHGGKIYFDLIGVSGEKYGIYGDPVDANYSSNVMLVDFNSDDPTGEYELDLPNYDYNYGVILLTGGTGYFAMDNFRWERYPTFVLDGSSAFESNIWVEESFTVDINYFSGQTCTVENETQGLSYSTTYIGNGTYRSEPIQLSITSYDENASQFIYFYPKCGAKENHDEYGQYMIRLNKYDELDNGSFEGLTADEGEFHLVNWATTYGGQSSTDPAGWVKNEGGSAQAEFVREKIFQNVNGVNYDSNFTADGRWAFYGNTTSVGEKTVLVNDQILNGGNLYFDIVRALQSFSGSMKIKYTKQSDGSITTLYTLNVPEIDCLTGVCDDILYDVEVAIPNYDGNIFITTNTYHFIIDNFRYSNNPTTLTIGHVPKYPEQEEDITFWATFVDGSSNPISDADCNLTTPPYGGGSPVDNAMTFNSDNNRFEYNQAFQFAGNYTFDVNCFKAGYNVGFDSSSVNVYDEGASPALLPFVITDITNVTHDYNYSIDADTDNFIWNNVTFTPTNQDLNMIFSIDNVNPSSEDLNMFFLNSIDDGRRYKIYTGNEWDYNNGIWARNDTLTFGSSGYDALQKIWQPANLRYRYFQDNAFLASEKIYFRLDFYEPAYSYDALYNYSSEWDNGLPPSLFDLNNTDMDLFTVSSYTDINSVLIDPKFPDVNSSVSPDTFVLQVNGKTDLEHAGYLRLGTTTELSGGTDSLTNFSLEDDFVTLTKTFTSGYAKVSSDANTGQAITLHDYAISERGYFTRPLEIFKANGEELDLYVEDATSYQYFTEGENILAVSEYLDPDGDIDYLELEAYIEPINQANRIKKWVFDATETGRVEFSEIVSDIIDLTSSAPNRNVKITLTLVDEDQNYYEVQSDSVRMVQYPYFPDDLDLIILPDNKIVGTQVNGNVILRLIAPNNLRGVTIYYGDANKSVSDLNYQIYFKDDDDGFTCSGFICSFYFEMDAIMHATTGQKQMIASLLLTTEEEDATDPRLSDKEVFLVSYLEYETLRILETVERTNHDYRPDEEIQLVLQLRDGALGNLKDDVEVWVEPFECDANSGSPNCFSFDVNYNYDAFLYDIATGYNYFFFREIFVKSDGSLPEDANYLRFIGHVTDKKSKHETTEQTLLVPKCQLNDTDCSDIFCFFANALAGLNHFLYGCTTPSPEVVTLDQNASYEGKLLMVEDKNLTAPTQECLFCMNVDNNNSYIENLEQQILCGSWYKFNEAPIDKFTFYMANINSDFSKEDDDAQYLRVDVPYPLIIYNDPILLHQAMALEYGTDADTLGELTWQVINNLSVGVLNPIGDVMEGYTGAGLIQNFGFDCNFSRPFDPTYVGGFVWFDLDGVKVINKQDLVRRHEELEDVNPVDLIEYMNYEGLSYSLDDTEVDVYASDLTKVLSVEVPSPLVIDVDYDDLLLNKQQTIDENGNVIGTWETLPSRLKFEAVNDLIYEGQTKGIRRYVPFWITALINPETFDWFGAFNDGIEDFLNNPIRFLFRNWFGVLLLMVMIMFVAVVYRNVKSGKGTGLTLFLREFGKKREG